MSILRPTSSASDMIDWTCPVNWLHPLNNGLVGWWLAVQNQGGWQSSRWLDLTGPVYGNHGTLTNIADIPAAWRSSLGRRGGSGAIDFAGGSDSTPEHVRLSSVPVASPPLTICGWAKMDDVTPTRHSFYTDETNSSSPHLYVEVVEVTASTTGRMRLFSGNYDSSGDTFNLDTEWHWYCYTWTTAEAIAYYRDGVSMGTGTRAEVTFEASPIPSFGAVTALGATAGGFTFNGKMDDWRIYDRVLSPGEAFALYDESRAGYPNMIRRVDWPLFAPAAAGGGGTILPLLNHYQVA